LLIKNDRLKPGVAHACDGNTWEVEAGGLRVKKQPGYIKRPCLKKKNGEIGSHFPLVE
jgi:hypothetical protein